MILIFEIRTEDSVIKTDKLLTILKPTIKGGNKKYPAFLVVLPKIWIKVNNIERGDFIQMELSKNELIIRPVKH